MSTRVLLDTNVLIHREAATVVRPDIGALFNWLDKLGYQKCVHPASVDEIEKHRDPKVRRTFRAKLASYHQLQTLAPVAPAVAAVGADDRTENDENDTKILNELVAERVDYLITEDRPLARKAATIGVATRVFTIDAFLEKVTAENPDLADYKVLAVRKTLFGRIDVDDPFSKASAKTTAATLSIRGSTERAMNRRTSVSRTIDSSPSCT